MSVFHGSIWAAFDPDAPPFEDYLGDMQLYLREMLRGPDGEDDGYEVIGGILKWQVPCNWKFGAENFAGDHYHGYSHRSVERLSIGLSGEKSRHARNVVRAARQFLCVADPQRGHTVRASVYKQLEPYESQWSEIPEVDADYQRAHDTDTFIGKRVDVLRRANGALRVLRRTIYLDQSVLLTRNLTTFF